MLNEAALAPNPDLHVIDYHDPVVKHSMATGQMNTAEAQILQNMASAIRRGHTQWRAGPIRPERICLVGSGPSLESTSDTLRDLVWNGAVLVTMNAGYHWAIQHGLKPATQIVLDARSSNARFVEPPVPKCNYVLASQCAPTVWDAVQGRSHVWIFHGVIKDEGATSAMLDAYYFGQWLGVGGGTTVATRALMLLRLAGYVRFDLFGVDCCWLEDQHHAVPQPENATDRRFKVTVGVNGHPETDRTFLLSPWHLKQLEDMLTVLKINGKHFTVSSHGDGLFTHILGALGSVDLSDLSMSATEE